MSHGLVLGDEDCPVTPDPRKQKHYTSFVAKLQLAESRIRFDSDISYAISMLACFCASAGPPQWAALNQLMEYRVGLS